MCHSIHSYQRVLGNYNLTAVPLYSLKFHSYLITNSPFIITEDKVHSSGNLIFYFLKFQHSKFKNEEKVSKNQLRGNAY